MVKNNRQTKKFQFVFFIFEKYPAFPKRENVYYFISYHKDRIKCIFLKQEEKKTTKFPSRRNSGEKRTSLV